MHKEETFKGTGKTPTEVAVEVLRKLEATKVSASSGTLADNAFYGGVTPGLTVSQHTYPCHYYMGHLPKDVTVCFSKFVFPNKDVYRKQTNEYFDWITGKDSPWASVLKMSMSFKEKQYFSPEFWRSSGFVFDRLNHVPSNVLHNFLVATRMPKEWPNRIGDWYYYVKEGISPEMAMVGTSMTFGTFSDHEKSRHEFASVPHYDWPLDVPSYGEGYVSNFLAKKMNEKSFNQPYSLSHTYTPVNAIWNSEDVKMVYPKVLETNYKDRLGKSFKSGNFGSRETWGLLQEEMAEILKEEEKRLRV